MDFRTVTAGIDDNQRRLDKIIRIYIPQISLSMVYKYLRKGLIKVNGKKVSENYKVCQGDEIRIAEFIFQDSETSIHQNDIKENTTLPPLPEIIFQNQHILILNKPYDLLVHGSKDSLDKIVENYYSNTINNESLSFKPGPLHRIDRKTTGLIAFSLSLEGAHWFTEKIKNHLIQKKYIAVVQGNLSKEEEWIDYIEKNQNIKSGFHTVNIQGEQTENSKEAYTIVKPLLSGKFKEQIFTVIELDIKTGRTHQIRSQCSLHKHPLLGDTAYGGIKIFGFKQDFFLQAYKLNFPADNPLELPQEIKIQPSPHLQNFLKSCYIDSLVL